MNLVLIDLVINYLAYAGPITREDLANEMDVSDGDIEEILVQLTEDGIVCYDSITCEYELARDDDDYGENFSLVD